MKEKDTYKEKKSADTVQDKINDIQKGEEGNKQTDINKDNETQIDNQSNEEQQIKSESKNNEKINIADAGNDDNIGNLVVNGQELMSYKKGAIITDDNITDETTNETKNNEANDDDMENGDNELFGDNNEQNVDNKWSISDWLKKIFSKSDEYYKGYGTNGEKIIKLKHFLNQENLKEILDNFILFPTNNNVNKVLVDFKALPMGDRENKIWLAMLNKMTSVKTKTPEERRKLKAIIQQQMESFFYNFRRYKAIITKQYNKEETNDSGLYGMLNNKNLPTANDTIVSLISNGINLVLLNNKINNSSTSLGLKSLFLMSPELKEMKKILSFKSDNPPYDGYEIFVENTKDIINNVANILLNLPDIISHPKDIKINIGDFLTIFNVKVKIENDLNNIKKKCIAEAGKLITKISHDKNKDIDIITDLEAELIGQQLINNIHNLKDNHIFSSDKNGDFYKFMEKIIHGLHKLKLERYKDEKFCRNLLECIRTNIGCDKIGSLFNPYNEEERKCIDDINRVYDDFCKNSRDVYVKGAQTMNSALKDLKNDIDVSLQKVQYNVDNNNIMQTSNFLLEKKGIGRSISDCGIGIMKNFGGCLFSTYSDVSEMTRNIKANYSKADINNAEQSNVVSQ